MTGKNNKQLNKSNSKSANGITNPRVVIKTPAPVESPISIGPAPKNEAPSGSSASSPKNESKRFNNKSSVPIMNKELKVEEGSNLHDILDRSGLSVQSTGSIQSVGSISPTVPTVQDENESSKNQKKVDSKPPTKAELLAELRNIARREARNIQEQNSNLDEEIYYHPPVSPSKHPLEYLREIYRTEDRHVELRPKNNRRVEKEISESSGVDVDSTGFKSFNDFDEGIFKFDSNSKMFHCPWEGCDKSFPSLSRIKRHYIIHTDLKPFKCLNPGCNRRFSRKDNMHQHYRVHCPFAGQGSKHH